jgi:hypothetical protein
VRAAAGGSEPHAPGVVAPGYTRAVSFHLRPPSVDKGVSAFFWAFGFFLYIWIGQLALGIGKGSAFVLAAVAGGAIFLFIRLFGEGGARRARR